MNVLETKNVSYRYPDGTPALEDVNFSAAQGKMVALLGPNGAGKSTLFLHFNGILRPSAGTVMVENVPLTYDKKSIMKVRQKVGIVFQNPDDQLFAPTVEEDVAFGPLNVGLDQDEVERRVAESLERVGMAGFEKKNPHITSVEVRRNGWP